MEKHGEKGFGLLEFLIYGAILSVIGLLVGGTFISLNQGKARNEARAEVNSQIRFVMDKIKQDLKEAHGVSEPADGTSSLKLILGVSGQKITYDVSAGVVRRQVNSAAPQALTSSTVSVTNLDFEHYRGVSIPLLKLILTIKVEITMRYNATSPDAQYSQTRRATFPLGDIFSTAARPDGTLLTPPPDIGLPPFDPGNQVGTPPVDPCIGGAICTDIPGI